MRKTLTRSDIAEAIYSEVGLSRNESGRIVAQILEEISDALVEGEIVKLSSFGRFAITKKGQRIGRNPRTGEEVPIKARTALLFRASNILKQKINRS